jgi:hypothetical protein
MESAKSAARMEMLQAQSQTDEKMARRVIRALSILVKVVFIRGNEDCLFRMVLDEGSNKGR